MRSSCKQIILSEFSDILTHTIKYNCMLYYNNIISDPYPDTRDPITGDWLPKSYNDVKADSMRKKEESQMRSSMIHLLNALK